MKDKERIFVLTTDKVIENNSEVEQLKKMIGADIIWFNYGDDVYLREATQTEAILIKALKNLANETNYGVLVLNKN